MKYISHRRLIPQERIYTLLSHFLKSAKTIKTNLLVFWKLQVVTFEQEGRGSALEGHPGLLGHKEYSIS